MARARMIEKDGGSGWHSANLTNELYFRLKRLADVKRVSVSLMLRDVVEASLPKFEASVK